MSKELEELLALRTDYGNPNNRTPGWDQRARSAAIKIVVKRHFGEVWDKDMTTTDAFLDALVELVERSDAHVG
jgi:hypothetical protein